MLTFFRKKNNKKSGKYTAQQNMMKKYVNEATPFV